MRGPRHAEDVASVAGQADPADRLRDFDLTCCPVNVMRTAGTGPQRARWARVIHDRCGRGPFVAVSGHSAVTRNHASGDDVARWFERAAGGTLFIDRIGKLSPPAQDRLFSLLTEQLRGGSGTKAGGDRHVRIITGCDRPLAAAVKEGAFESALFYRLNEIHIDLDRPDRPSAAQDQ
jgi:DNA-binding NtrC family response regulator